MKVTQVGEIHNCDCGFSWRTGKSGSHECGYGLRKQLAELKAERDALAAAHSELRESMAAIHNTIRLDGVNTSLGALLSASKRAHEASVPTDAHLNSVRAEVIPEGYVIVPQQMHLSADAMESLCFHCGDGGFAFGDFTDGLLWVGDIENDDGTKTYGLNIATAEYPEEGSANISEFAAQLRAGKDGD